MKLLFQYFVGSLILISSLQIFAQDNHYWMNQFGPTSNYLGGAVTGGVRDNSSIFYNPGAAAFTSLFNISLQINEITNQNYHVKNGAGTGINVHQNRFETIPQMWAMTFGNKKRPDWRYSIGILTTSFSNIRFNARNEELKDIYPSLSGNEVYVGSWNYGNRMREDQFGLSVSRKVRKNLGIGATAFVTFKSYEYNDVLDQSIFSGPDEVSGKTLRHFSEINNVDGSAAGILLKIGLAYEVKEFKIGLTVTTPRAQLNFLGSMNYYSSVNSQFSQQDSVLQSPNYTLLMNKAKSTYKSPWIIDFGFMKNFFDTDIYIRAAYYSAVQGYNMVEPKDPGEYTIAVLDVIPGAGELLMAQREVWNFSLGWHRDFTKSFGMMAGIRTNFNNLNQSFFESTLGITPQISYWDLYHFSAGTTITVFKNKFTVGLTYTTGKTGNEYQFVNLNAPSQDVLFNDLEKNASADIDQVGITIGWVYNFRLDEEPEKK